ncbi:MAG: hypothetical protein Q4B09_00810, partial [Lachnospiraceae bacterium]|nr:hypothetical protein [Lachnospiraceae bacterium]
MRIDQTKRIMERMGRLINDRNLNANVNRHLTAALGRQLPKDMEALEKMGEAYRTAMEEKKVTLTSEQAQITSMVVETAREHYKDIFHNPAEEGFVMSTIALNSRMYAADAFAEDPFIRDVKLNQANAGDYRFGMVAFRPGQLFMYNTPRRAPGRFVDLPRIGAFKEEARFPGILKAGKLYKNVTPNEIETMAPHIKAARGNVLVLGLGAGYFPYLASLQDAVQTVTVIENDPALVELFEEHIMPQLSTADKIRVLEDSPAEFLSDLDDGIYDRCFFAEGNLDSYLEMTELCARFKKMKITYWIEDAFCMNLSTYVYLDMLQALGEAGAIKAPDV